MKILCICHALFIFAPAVPADEPSLATATDRFEAPSKLDLRPFLPIPLKQKKHNCVAFAIGYASYSCQICQERRGTKPDEPHEIFSPSYIYNALSEGGDEGLHVREAIDFIKEHGCATLQTMPIDQPAATSLAKQEAGLYCAIGHQRATGIEEIREYLQEGIPIILVVRADDEFYDGDFAEPYRWDTEKLHKQFSLHAVCAVGYDDGREAVLVMNSSGPAWKDDGFAWVSYDTLQTIPKNRGGVRRDGSPVRDEELPFWCVEAHVAIVKERTPSVALPFDGSEIDFRLNNGMVYNGNLRVSFDAERNAEWRIDDLACNRQTIFLLRHDQLVVRMANPREFLLDDESATWTHLHRGIPDGSTINMIATVPGTPLFAMTDKGALLQLHDIGNHWWFVQVDGKAFPKITDLRDHNEGFVTAVTADGHIFQFKSNMGWTEVSMH